MTGQQQLPQEKVPVHRSSSVPRQPVLRGHWQPQIVARGDQLAFAAEVVRFGFSPDDFAIDVKRLRDSWDGRTMTPRFVIDIENIRSRRKMTYQGWPDRAWIAKFVADLTAEKFGQA